MSAARLVLMVLAGALLVPSSAVAALPPQGYYVDITHYLNPDGTGMLIANDSPGQGSITWQACPSGGACSPIASDPQHQGLLKVGDAAAGTVFVATAIDGAQTASASSAPYRGRLSPIAPPAVVGELRVGEHIQPAPGSWGGGWDREFSEFQMHVCRTSGGTGCVVISDTYWFAAAGLSARLVPGDCGLYVRVVEARASREAPRPANAYGGPITGLPPIEPGALVSAAIAGPVVAARGSRCDPKAASPTDGRLPRIRLRARPLWRSGRLVLGRITCIYGCMVVAVVRQDGRRIVTPHRLGARAVSRPVWMQRGSGLKRGKATVSVKLEGVPRRTLASRGVSLPPR